MLSALANSFGFLYAARVALGIAESPFFTSGLKVADKWFNKTERALPVSIVNTGSQIANAIAPPLLTFLMLTMSWRGMFIVIGALGIVIALVWLRIYRDPTMKEQFIIKGAEFEEQQQPKEKQASWGELLKQEEHLVHGPRRLRHLLHGVGLPHLAAELPPDRARLQPEPDRLARRPAVPVRHHRCADRRHPLRQADQARGSHRYRPQDPDRGRGAPRRGRGAAGGLRREHALAIVLLSVGYFAAQVPIGVLWTLASDIADSNQVASLGAIQNFGGFLGAAVAPIVTGYILNETGGNYTLVFLIGGVLLIVGALSYGIFVKDRRTVPGVAADLLTSGRSSRKNRQLTTTIPKVFFVIGPPVPEIQRQPAYRPAVRGRVHRQGHGHHPVHRVAAQTQQLGPQ